MNKRLIVSIVICVLQVVDLLVHVLTGNIEPLRILCMGGIIFTVILSYFIQSQSFQIIRGSIIGYLIGNGVFLLQNSIFNNEGSPRILFFVFVIVTTILMVMLLVHTRIDQNTT